MKVFHFYLIFTLNIYQIYGKPFSSPFQTIIGRSLHQEVQQAFRCEDGSSPTCTLNNILIEDEGTAGFIPVAETPSKVTKVEIKSSKIPTLTSGICDNFPNLEILIMKDVNLKKIMPGALNGCTKLKEIQLQDNFISDLDKNTFQQNKLLEKIILNSNNLTSIANELFSGLSSLKTIDLCVNRLSRLPAQIFSGLESMENLEVQNNPLLSLEIEKMKINMPNLQHFLFRDVDLTCDRSRQIIKFCEANKISYYLRDDYPAYHTKSPSSYLRKRSYVVTTENDFECLSNEQYEREVYLRETLPKLLQGNQMEDPVDLQSNFENLNHEYAIKFDQMMKKVNETLLKIFEGQNYMLNLVKEKIENQNNQIRFLATHVTQVMSREKTIDVLESFDENQISQNSNRFDVDYVN